MDVTIAQLVQYSLISSSSTTNIDSEDYTYGSIYPILHETNNSSITETTTTLISAQKSIELLHPSFIGGGDALSAWVLLLKSVSYRYDFY